MTFTPEEVEKLWRYQMPTAEDIANFKVYHPFTCANRGDGKHVAIGSDLGMLIPTVNGWICPFCDYKQDWAHDFMLDRKAPTGPDPGFLRFAR